MKWQRYQEKWTVHFSLMIFCFELVGYENIGQITILVLKEQYQMIFVYFFNVFFTLCMVNGLNTKKLAICLS